MKKVFELTTTSLLILGLIVSLYNQVESNQKNSNTEVVKHACFPN
ncbi:hypothetical protein [Thalassobacillus sp. C254]|nr:hypothetical protein [Thalassobacillus sp. C254]